MSDKVRKILIPQYIKQFHCIGSACEDSCCIGWTVAIDKETYKRYRACHDSEMRRQMDVQVTRQRTNATDENYAKIKLKDNISCPFLDSKKLCVIQRKLGENYLSRVCTTYPRIANNVFGVIEKSLTMSCPEALRLALLNPALMEFEEAEESVGVCNIVGQVIDPNKYKAFRHVGYFWELRIFIISLLQNRNYDLWQRLVILGLFCRKLDQLVLEHKEQEIPQLIEIYSHYLNDELFSQELANIPDAVTVQMELLKEVADARLFMGINSGRFLECFNEFLAGIEYTAGASKDEIVKRYAMVYEQYYQPFMTTREYILENYLVNYVFKNLFPLGRRKRMFDNYTLLIVHYALIKMFLIGMAGFHKRDFGVRQVAKLIQSFSHEIEHSDAYLTTVLNLLKAGNYNTMPYMAILLKN